MEKKKDNNIAAKLICLFAFAGFGILMMVMITNAKNHASMIIDTWNPAEATVTNFYVETDSDDDDTYYASLEYKADGIFLTASRVYLPSYANIGDVISIYYNPDDPSDVEADVKPMGSLFYFNIMALGVIMIGFGIFLFVKLESSDKQTTETGDAAEADTENTPKS